jgi:starch synthase
VLTPSYDNKIARKYSSKTLEEKAKNKAALETEIGWVEEPKRAIVCLPTGMSESLGGALFEALLPGILELGVGLVVRGRGSDSFGALFTSLEKKYDHAVKILADEETSMRKMLAGADIALFCAKGKECEAELGAALRYGVIPVAPAQTMLANYNPVQESGNSFTFEEATPWQCFAALVRALETFKFPYDWRTIQRSAMESMEEVKK